MGNEYLSRAAKRRKEVMGRRGLKRKPPRTPEPLQFERRYQAELVGYVREIEEKIDRLLIDRLPMLHQEAGRFDSWANSVDEILDDIRLFADSRAKELEAGLRLKASDLGEWNTAQFRRSVRTVLGVDITGDVRISTMIESWANENAKLIQSIPERMLTQVEGIAQRGLRSGTSVRDLTNEIRDRFEVTESRARLIARDQIGKLNGQITRSRQTALGIDTYIWQTSADERVRANHRVMEGKICRWDDPTVYSDDGKEWKARSSIGAVELHPGQDYQCRCAALPDLSEILKGVDGV